MDKKESKLTYILLELAHHLPYSIFGVALGLIVMGVLTFLAILMRATDLLPEASEHLFHVFHPSHILFSTVTTTAMFWKHEKRLLKAVIVGILGSVTICGLSDIFFPFIGGLLLGQQMEVHICILQEPQLIVPFLVLGILGGLLVPQTFEHSTEYSHSAHIFVSSAASILYLMSFGFYNWIESIGAVFLITVFAVMIPCCTSDIVFPISCVHRGCRHK